MNLEETHAPQTASKKFAISPGAGILTGAVIIALVLLFKLPSSGTTPKNGAPAGEPTTPTQVATEIVIIRATDHVSGNPATAKVIAFEYSDSDCPYCQQFHMTMKQVLADYGSDIAWVYRHFPLSIHPNAKNEAVALECAAQLGGNSAFYQYLDQVFSVTVAPDQSAGILSGLANTIGLDQALFGKCLSSPKAAEDRITSDSSEAQENGAQGTPFTILVNKAGEQVVLAGAYPLANVKESIDGLMK